MGEGFRGDVVINELLTHTDLPEIDGIELHNRTNQPIDTAGWYISDSAANLFRFQIGDNNSVVYPEDYQTYFEDELGFGFRGQAPDNAFLVEPDSTGRPVRFVDSVTYNATQNGVTLGRWSNGEGELFPMAENSLEDANSGPLISPVIISEVQYHPESPVPGSVLSEDDLEFIEIYNRTGAPIDIGLWRLNDYAANEMALYTFPENTVLPAGSTLIVLGFNPANVAKRNEFVATYRVPDSIPLLGPYSDAAYDPNPDQLNNDGETLLLERPEDLEQLGLGYVLEDRVIYSNTAPWPEDASGTGLSLTRAYRNRYGDFPENWQAVMPTPGRPLLPGDVNGDGLVDATDIDMSCAAANLGGNTIRYDHNRDGDVDYDDVEFLVFDILDTTIGDANLDGFFDSSDFVFVFVAGQYENGIPGMPGGRKEIGTATACSTAVILWWPSRREITNPRQRAFLSRPLSTQRPLPRHWIHDGPVRQRTPTATPTNRSVRSELLTPREQRKSSLLRPARTTPCLPSDRSFAQRMMRCRTPTPRTDYSPG